MMCDALMEETHAEIAVENPGGVRIDTHPAGDITVSDPSLSVTAEYEGRKAVVVPGNYMALSSYLRKDAASMLFFSMDREKALKLTVCDIATIYIAPQNESGDVVLIELVTKNQVYHMRTDGGNQWDNLLACCMKGTYHDDNISLE